MSAGRALAALLVDATTSRTATFDLGARINRIAELRTTRLAQANTSIVSVLWFALLAIPLLLLAGIGLVYDEHPAFHYTLTTLVAVATSIAIFVAVELDLPYRGVGTLSAAPIANSVDQALSESLHQP